MKRRMTRKNFGENSRVITVSRGIIGKRKIEDWSCEKTMENDIQIFEYGRVSVRLVQNNGTPWFVAKDVCDVLGLANPTVALEALDEDERSKFFLGRQGEANIISESGLYTLIMRSNKPEAKQFRKWVTSKVLPSIRQHGFYATPAKVEDILADPDTFIRILQELKAERSKVRQLTEQAEANAPKIVLANAIETSGDSVLIGNFAAILKQNGVDIGQNRLFTWFREKGWLIKCRGRRWNMPTQRGLNEGFFEAEERVITKPNGGTEIKYTPKLTGKGQIYFMNFFMQRGEK